MCPGGEVRCFRRPRCLWDRKDRERERDGQELCRQKGPPGAFLVDGEGEGLTNASGVEPEGLDWGDEVGGIDGRVQNEAGLAVEVAGEKPGLRSRSRGEGGRFLRWRSLNERDEGEIASVDSLGDPGEGGSGARLTCGPGGPGDCSRSLCASALPPCATRRSTDSNKNNPLAIFMASERFDGATGGATLGLAFLFPLRFLSSLASHRLAAKPA